MKYGFVAKTTTKIKIQYFTNSELYSGKAILISPFYT